MKKQVFKYNLFFVLLCLQMNAISQNNTLNKNKKLHFIYTNNHFTIGLNDIARGCAILHYERIFNYKFGVEIGAGLTFDDLYALKYWEGDQYIKRNKPQDTRFTYSLNYRTAPFQNIPFLYFGAGIQYRKFYSADKDAFFQYNGYWVGSKRKELDGHLKIGNFFTLGEHILIDYYVGLGFRLKHDNWTFDHKNNLGQTYFVSGEEQSMHLNYVLGLKLGFGF